jgi:hypothetical protein
VEYDSTVFEKLFIRTEKLLGITPVCTWAFIRSFIHSFISVDPYRITNPLDMESGNNNTKYAKQLQYTGC